MWELNKENIWTDLHTDGMDDANLIALRSPKVIWEFVIVWATIVKLRFAARSDHCLRGQIDYVCETSV